MYEDYQFKLSEEEIYLFYEGTFCYAYKKFGAHAVTENDVSGVRFTVWAPSAIKVGVAGEFNNWQALEHLLVRITNTGIWTAFFPGIQPGDLYKYGIYTLSGEVFLKADPFAFCSEKRPETASIISSKEKYNWGDEQWQKKKVQPYQQPINIYEVHLGSWRRKPDGGFMNYREIAHEMADYALEMGYTHLELLPVMEHPFDDSWGYQVTGYYSVTSRFGTPEDFKYFIDYCHKKGLGIILDWVPSHFCRDEHGLVRFDGTKLYEAGESAQWGTYYFDFSKPEVVSFLISNAIYWFEVFHVDGLRVDAVASMLYLDYGKEENDWVPNKYGGNEQLEAVKFIKKLHETVFRHVRNPLMIAEESTSWPLVTKPTYDGGLGFNYKWNMGWMNDVLEYMSKATNNRKAYHHKITFSFLYTFSENFILPLSHDEVVHGKKALIEKMPGDYWQKFANLRLLFGYMIAHPGKKLIFMGAELAQFHEWRHYEELYWRILEFDMHRSFQQYVKELNHFYLSEKALWEQDHDCNGFSWIEADNSKQSVAV
jgi:1,4-alpha-glucan branching enzyme